MILIILSTITINFAFGENGLVSMTEDARDITTEATEKEGIEMAVADSKIKDITTPDREKENLEESLRSQFGNDADFIVTENGDGSFLITMNDSQRSYYLESTGEIIAQSEWIEIGTAEELKAFRDEVNSGNSYEGKYIRLTSNITLDSGEEWEPIGLYPNESPTQDNENNKPFSGTFDGCGYEIDGIYINTTDKVQGLFGLVNKAIIKNIKVGKNNVISGGLVTGSVVAYAYNESKIYNCHNETNIVGNGKTTGGIVGIANTNVIVEKCSNKANITGKDDNVGGIVGNCINGSIVNSNFNTGNISGEKNIVGGCIGTAQYSCQIVNNYNIGEIYGNNYYLGGIIGLLTDSSTLSNCYNIGNVIGGLAIINGVAGDIMNNSNISNSYFLENIVNDANGTSTIEGVSIKTSEELKNLAPTLGSAFKDDYEEENINDGYPILSWQ